MNKAPQKTTRTKATDVTRLVRRGPLWEVSIWFCQLGLMKHDGVNYPQTIFLPNQNKGCAPFWPPAIIIDNLVRAALNHACMIHLPV